MTCVKIRGKTTKKGSKWSSLNPVFRILPSRNSTKCDDESVDVYVKFIMFAYVFTFVHDILFCRNCSSDDHDVHVDVVRETICQKMDASNILPDGFDYLVRIRASGRSDRTVLNDPGCHMRRNDSEVYSFL